MSQFSRCIWTFIVCSALLANAQAKESTTVIQANEAAAHVNEGATVEGVVAKVFTADPATPSKPSNAWTAMSRAFDKRECTPAGSAARTIREKNSAYCASRFLKQTPNNFSMSFQEAGAELGTLLLFNVRT
jgi:hypothetical protein